MNISDDFLENLDLNFNLQTGRMRDGEVLDKRNS